MSIEEMLSNFVMDGCWHSDGDLITEDCAVLNCCVCAAQQIHKHYIESASGEILSDVKRDDYFENELEWLYQRLASDVEALVPEDVQDNVRWIIKENFGKAVAKAQVASCNLAKQRQIQRIFEFVESVKPKLQHHIAYQQFKKQELGE